MTWSGVTQKNLMVLVVGMSLAIGTFAQAPGRDGEEADRKGMVDSPNAVKTEATRPASVQSSPKSPKKRPPQFLLDFVGDQKDLWSSPKEFRFQDASWLVPLSGFSAGLFVTDSDVSRHLSHDPKTISRYNNLSNAGVAALVGGAGGMWVLSHFNHNAQWRETGFLSGEAAIHSLVMTEALKYSLRRERPDQGDGTGPFFQHGGTSFPSEHSAAAWSVASVIAHEYPGTFTKLLAYGAATMVSYSRIHAEKHFPSDVLIGALLGQLAAHQVYTKHHDFELGGDIWRSPTRLFYEDGHAKPGFIGSPYVPLDSWIYTSIDRLAAMGVVDGAFAGSRPWTRLACAQIVAEAQDRALDAGPVASELMNDLQSEFRPELGGGAERGETTARLESLYFRGENISGMPLTDGYHFAQTQINDFGRPYGEGWSTTSGSSFYSSSGPWSAYVRGEVQTAPSVPALPLSARQFVSNADFGLPVAPGNPSPSVQQFQLLDAYVGLTFSDWQLSFGRQSLDWGPGEGGSLIFSDNAAPIDMFRINRVAPLNIPLLSRVLGPWRGEFFFGHLSGHHFAFGPEAVIGNFSEPLQDQPFLYGGHFTFKPTRNFEFGFSFTTIMGGPGVPLTFGTFKHSLFGFNSNGLPGTPQDPGDRRSGIDWTYRLPLLRRWVTFYGDAFADDQLSPIAYWDRSAIRGGLFISHLPKLSRLDVRMEGVYTDVPAGGAIGHGFFYSNNRFRNGYTNDGFLLGSWIGRDGQGAQGWLNYWFTSRNRIELSFRHQKASQQFNPGGGTLTDAGIRGDYWLRGRIGLTASVQYEKWLFPVIQPGPQRNVGASVGIQFQPQRIFRPALHLMTSKATEGEDQN